MARLYPKPIFRLAGDRGLLLEFGNAIDPEINQRVRSVFLSLNEALPSGIKEIVPTYRSLLIYYDPLLTNPRQLELLLEDWPLNLSNSRAPSQELHEIPVCYGGDMGPDMAFVSSHSGLDPDEIVRIHSEQSYLVYMVGFTPGFPFLGVLPKSLHTPRLQSPRTFVPAGSVGIANEQTGVYPIDSPGGWQIIGRTPVKLFNPTESQPFRLKMGDLVKFVPITLQAYRRLSGGHSGQDHGRAF